MKIEWLNDSLTRAHVTRGLFRKVQSTLVRVDCYSSSCCLRFHHWVHEETRKQSGVDRRMEWARGREEKRRVRAKSDGHEWRPVHALPEARTVRR